MLIIGRVGCGGSQVDNPSISLFTINNTGGIYYSKLIDLGDSPAGVSEISFDNNKKQLTVSCLTAARFTLFALTA